MATTAMQGFCRSLFLVVLCWQLGEYAVSVEGSSENEFTPAAVFWADGSSFVTESGDVSKWRNKLDENQWMESDRNVAQRRPNLNANCLTGIQIDGEDVQCAVFSGGDPDSLMYSLSDSIFDEETLFSLFVVMRHDAAGNDGEILSMDRDIKNQRPSEEGGWRLYMSGGKLELYLHQKKKRMKRYLWDKKTPENTPFVLAIRKTASGDDDDKYLVEVTILDDVDTVNHTDYDRSVWETIKDDWYVSKDEKGYNWVLGTRMYNDPNPLSGPYNFDGDIFETLLFDRAVSNDEFDCIANRLKCKYKMGGDSCHYEKDEYCTTPAPPPPPSSTPAPEPVENCEGGGCCLAGAMDSCCEGWACSTWSLTKKSGGDCHPEEECVWEACLTVDTSIQGCAKDGDISHVCDPKTEGRCSAENDDATLDAWWKDAFEVADNVAVKEMCQTGKPGDTLWFMLKDGAACNQGAMNYVHADTSAAITCAPNPNDASCTGNGMGKECLWSIVIPSCGDTPDPQTEPIDDTPAHQDNDDDEPETPDPLTPDPSPSPEPSDPEEPQVNSGTNSQIGGSRVPPPSPVIPDDPNCPVPGGAQEFCSETCHYLARCELVTVVGNETDYAGECDDSDSDSDSDSGSGSNNRRRSGSSDSDGGSSGSGTEAGSAKKSRAGCTKSKGQGGSSGSSSSGTDGRNSRRKKDDVGARSSGSSGKEGSSGWSSGSETDFDAVYYTYINETDFVPQWRCVCPPGLYGNGTYCSTNAWAVRTVVKVDSDLESCRYVGRGCSSGSDTDGSGAGGGDCSDGSASESNSDVDEQCRGNQDEYCLAKCIEHHDSPSTPCWKAFCNNGGHCSMSPHVCCASSSGSDSGSASGSGSNTDSSGSESSGEDDGGQSLATCDDQKECMQFRFTQKTASKCTGAECEWEVCLELDLTGDNCPADPRATIGHVCESPFECDHTSGPISLDVDDDGVGYVGNPWFFKGGVTHGYQTCQVGSSGSTLKFLVSDGKCGAESQDLTNSDHFAPWLPSDAAVRCGPLQDGVEDCVESRRRAQDRHFMLNGKADASFEEAVVRGNNKNKGGFSSSELQPKPKGPCVWEVTLPPCGAAVEQPPVLTGFKAQCPCTPPPELPPEAQILKQWAKISVGYSNLLINGEDRATEASVDAQRTNHHHVLRDCKLNVTTVTMSQLFATWEEAQEAAKHIAGDNQVLLIDLLAREFQSDPEILTVLAPPETTPWVAGLDCDPVVSAGTGLEVTNVEFDWNCATAGCWRIDVEYFRGADGAVNVLYMPKVEGDDTLEDGGGYTQAEQDQYRVSNFPCSVDDIGNGNGLQTKHTACCLFDFVDKYRTLAEFERWVRNNQQLATCDPNNANNDPSSNLLLSRNQSAPDATGVVSGTLPGMPNSKVIPTGVLDYKNGKFGLQMELDEVELRRLGGMIKGVTSVKHDIQTFIGMAYLNPTNTRVMDAFTRQTFLTLERTDYFSLATAGNNDYSFLEYVNIRLHQVENEANPSDSRKLQYITVTFTLPQSMDPNPATNVVPLTSIRIGQGERKSSAVWGQSCASDDNSATWEQDGMEDAHEEFFDQDCAPSTRVCRNPVLISDNFVAMTFPMGFDYFDARGAQWAGGRRRIFVEFVVSVIDNSLAEPKAVNTKVLAMLTVSDGGVNMWCAAASARTDLGNVANADLIVGSAATDTELDRLRIFEDIASSVLSPQQSTKIDTDSIESGLMTLVVKGLDEYFGLPAQTGTSLELEDLITLHIMESGSILYNEVRQLVASDDAFDREIDARDHSMHLTPSDALSNYCSFRPGRPSLEDPFPTSCIVRRDVEGRLFPQFGDKEPTAIELPQKDEDSTEASKFMQTILGSSEYAFALGGNFSQVIAQRYSLNGRSIRAWWINPGYEWAPQQTGERETFSLSQRIILVGLIKLNEQWAAENAPARRLLVHAGAERQRGGAMRALKADKPYGEGLSQLNLEFNVNSGIFVAMALNVEPKRVTTWFMAMLLTDEQACMESLALRRSLGETLVGYLKNSASDVQHVMVTSVRVDRGTVDCLAQRRDLEWYSGASAYMECAVVFTDPQAFINLKLLGQMSGVIEVEPVLSYNNVVVDNTYVPGGLAADTPPDSSGPPINLLITAIVGAGAGVILAVCGACVWRRSSRKEMEREAVLAAGVAKQEMEPDEEGRYRARDETMSVPLQEIKQQLKSEILYDLTPVGSTPPGARDQGEELSGKGVERRIFSKSFSSFAAFGFGKAKPEASGPATADNSPTAVRAGAKLSGKDDDYGEPGGARELRAAAERQSGSAGSGSGGRALPDPEEVHPGYARKTSRESRESGESVRSGRAGRAEPMLSRKASARSARSGRSGRSGRRRRESPSESESSASSRSRSRSRSRSGSPVDRSPSPGEEDEEERYDRRRHGRRSGEEAAAEEYFLEVQQQQQAPPQPSAPSQAGSAAKPTGKSNFLLF